MPCNNCLQLKLFLCTTVLKLFLAYYCQGNCGQNLGHVVCHSSWLFQSYDWDLSTLEGKDFGTTSYLCIVDDTIISFIPIQGLEKRLQCVMCLKDHASGTDQTVLTVPDIQKASHLWYLISIHLTITKNMGTERSCPSCVLPREKHFEYFTMPVIVGRKFGSYITVLLDEDMAMCICRVVYIP